MMLAGTDANTLSVASWEKRPLDRGSALATPRFAKSGACLVADWRAARRVSPQALVSWGRSEARSSARPSVTTVMDLMMSL